MTACKKIKITIYYLTADNIDTAQNSPHLEIFKQKNIEVLLLCDNIDEWLVSHLTEFEGKKLQSITKGDLDLTHFEDKAEQAERETEKQTFDGLISQIKTALGDLVTDVRITHRLTDSPACVVVNAEDMDFQMQRLMQSMGENFAGKAPILELNPKHQILTHMHDMQDDTQLNEWAHLLLDQAVLAEGGQLKDPAGFVSRLK